MYDQQSYNQDVSITKLISTIADNNYCKQPRKAKFAVSADPTRNRNNMYVIPTQ